MNKRETILALGNALIMLDMVETKGEKNLNALLAGMQQVRRVYKDLKEAKEEKKDENYADA